eukprot:1185211-Prymnesium_polylepis.1
MVRLLCGGLSRPPPASGLVRHARLHRHLRIGSAAAAERRSGSREALKVDGRTSERPPSGGASIVQRERRAWSPLTRRLEPSYKVGRVGSALP